MYMLMMLVESTSSSICYHPIQVIKISTRRRHMHVYHVQIIEIIKQQQFMMLVESTNSSICYHPIQVYQNKYSQQAHACLSCIDTRNHQIVAAYILIYLSTKQREDACSSGERYSVNSTEAYILNSNIQMGHTCRSKFNKASAS